MSEQTEVVNPIIQYLTMTGAIAIRINSGAMTIEGKNGPRMFRGAPAGTSDIIAGIPVNGRLVFAAIECKVKGNRPTDLQYRFLQDVHQAGGLSVVAYSLDDVTIAIEHARRP
jgi:hypothetical protein